MKPQTLNGKNECPAKEKTTAILWRMSSELIGVYLWFLKFSNVLLKLIQ